MEELPQIVAAETASRGVGESLAAHVSRRERNRRPITPTTHDKQGNASVNAQESVISQLTAQI